jgi:hypothetical protein
VNFGDRYRYLSPRFLGLKTGEAPQGCGPFLVHAKDAKEAKEAKEAKMLRLLPARCLRVFASSREISGAGADCA